MTNRIAVLIIIDQSEETSRYIRRIALVRVITILTVKQKTCVDADSVSEMIAADRYIEVTEWKGELRVDLREWKADKPTKKGISLTLMRFKNWVDYLEYADQARTEKQNYKSHLGGNVYCTVAKDRACMDIRQY